MLVLPADVADSTAVEVVRRVFAEVLEPIDVWGDNAVASVFSPVSAVTPDEFERVTEVTHLGWCVRDAGCAQADATWR